MAAAAVKRYWDWLPDRCVCGASAEQIHHIIHVNHQRISKDDWLVVKLCALCALCHQRGPQAVHKLGGERQFLEQTGHDLVHLAMLHRHNFEVRA